MANAGNQGKVQPGGFITTKKPTVVDNKGLEPVGGPTLGGLLPTGTGTHGTCSDIGIPDEICNFINKPCETINLPPEICKYFPAILLGVAALAIFGLLKWIL